MENKAKKYELNQNGKKYILSTQIFQDKLRFACIEQSPLQPIIYIGEFTVIELTKISSIFSSLTEISKAQELFDKIITSQKLSLEPNNNYLNLNIIIKQENQPDENFIIKLNLLNQTQTITTTNNAQETITMQMQTTNIDNNNFQTENNNLDENLLYSPINNSEEGKNQGQGNEQFIQQTTNEQMISTSEQNINSPLATITTSQEQQYINEIYNDQQNKSPNLISDINMNNNINIESLQEQYLQTPENININTQDQNLNIQSSNGNIINTENQFIQSSEINNSSSADNFLQEFFKSSGSAETQGQYIEQQQSENNVISSQEQQNINLQNNIINTNNATGATTTTTTTTTTKEQYIEQPTQITTDYTNMQGDLYQQPNETTTTTTTNYEQYFQQTNPEIVSQTQNEYIQNIQQHQPITTNTNKTTTTQTQTQYIQIPTSTITTQKQYIIGNQTMEGQTTNYNVTQNEVRKIKKIKSEKVILPLRPLPQQPEVEKIQETNYESSAQIYSPEPVKEPEIIPQYNPELDNLRDENARLKEEIRLLKNQLNIYVNEIRTIKQTNIKQETTNDGDYQQLLYLKEENERYLREIERLRIELNGINEYKMQKEEEINILNVKIQSLLSRINDLERLNQDLRAYIEKLSQKKESMIQGGSEALTIQDTRLEIIRGDIIENAKELELLARKICDKKYKKISLNLIYKAIIDSDKAEVFHKKCNEANNTLVLVKSGNNKRFGGYTTCNWQGNSIEKKDDNAFVFSLDKMKIYKVIKGEDAIACYPKYGPIFLGCQIRIYDQFFKNGGTTFEKGLNYETEEDYELSGGLKKFDVKDLEVYSVEFE